MKTPKPKKRKFSMLFHDPSADGGMAKITFDPSFDRVPSTGEFVTSEELGRQFHRELMSKERIKYWYEKN